MTAQIDSPLSITASVAGILTFVVALLAAGYVRFTYLRNADSEYFQVKTSLSWYKTESQWMTDLIQSSDLKGTNGGTANEMEYEMYSFVMDQLGKLEERLLGLVTEAEERATKEEEESGKRWTLVPRRVVWRTSIAMNWLPVRAKALELVRQREALASRVLFAQMSMISSRVRDQETRSRKREEAHKERLDRLETMAYSQHDKLDRLESLVYRVMHRERVGYNGNSERPKYEEKAISDREDAKYYENHTPEATRKPEVTAQYYPASSI